MIESGTICPGCGDDVSSRVAFCPSCGAPTDAVSNLDPASLPESEGRMVSRAVEHPRRPIVVIGIWMIFAPIFILGVVMIIQSVRRELDSWSANFIFFWFGIAALVLSSVTLFRVTRNYFRRPPRPEVE
ncbi:MAG: hypothetical protein KBD94_08380 [Pyrinomonadaceae bacterium]|nr:hypothetical protein [Pyrinomonadaceae bacterium]